MADSAFQGETGAVKAVMKRLQRGSHKRGRAGSSVHRASSVTKMKAAGKQKGKSLLTLTIRSVCSILLVAGIANCSVLPLCCITADNLIELYDSCQATQCVARCHADVAAGKASAAIDAALEAVRKHWIQKELTGSSGPSLAIPAAKARPGTTAGSGPPVAAAGSLRSNSGTLAAVGTESHKSPAGEGGVTGPMLQGASGAPLTAGGMELAANTVGAPATSAPAAGLAARLVNRNVSRIFSSRGKQLHRIGEAKGAVDDDAEGEGGSKLG